jgi:hypothetical protein
MGKFPSALAINLANGVGIDNRNFTQVNFPSNSTFSTLDKIFSVIEDLYIYGHLKNYENYSKEELEQDENIAKTIMLILIIIFSFTMIKVAVISVYFFFITVLCNAGKFFIYVFQKKCCVDFKKEFKFACFYLGKIMKKLYTYNFYAFENKILGVVLVLLYLVFLFFNILFTSEYMEIKQDYGVEIPEGVKVLQIVAFELTIFMELVCGCFYVFRSVKKQFTVVLSSFFGLNLIISIAVFYKIDQDDENPRRYANLFFLTYFSVLFLISAIKVAKYDINCKKILNIFSGGLEMYTGRKD